MRKWFSAILTLVILFSLAVPGLSKANAEGINGVVDDNLLSALKTATGPLEVIVTFDGQGAPSKDNLNLLDGLGISTGVLMKALPIAGVLATKDQISKLASLPGVKSIYLN